MLAWVSLNEAIVAVDAEIEAARTSARSYELENGQLVAITAEGYLYQFPFEHDVSIPDDSEGELEVGSDILACRVLALINNLLFLSVAPVERPLGMRIESAKLTLQPWWVLEALRSLLESARNNEAFDAGRLHLRRPRSPPATDLVDLGRLAEGYNPSQVDAADMVLRSEASAVWGPPGTGKTKTAALVVGRLLQTGHRVLCIAPSNTAVDQLAKGVAALLERYDPQQLRFFIRYGFPIQPEMRDHPVISPRAHIRRVDPDLFSEWATLEQELAVAAKGQSSAQLRPIAERLREVKQKARSLLQAQLPRLRGVATTLAMTISDQAVRESGPFDLLLVDEASMVGALPLMVGEQLAHRLALFGDFRQLPPVTSSDHPSVRKWLGRTGFDLWGIPDAVDRGLFPPYLRMLDIQYRMHPAIRDKVSRFAYGDRLRDAPVVGRRHEEASRPPFPGEAVVRIDISHLGAEACRPEGGSRWNDISAAVAIGLAAQARASGYSPVAVITPYREQARLLYRLSKGLGLTEVITGTVHRFQGGEAPFVIFDLVEAGRRRTRGWRPFFDDDEERTASRLFTVALSRAMVKVAVVGDWPLLCSERGPTKLAPVKRIWRTTDPVWKRATPCNLRSKNGQALVWLGNEAELPLHVASAVASARTRVVVHWPSGTVPTLLLKALNEFRAKSRDVGEVSFYPPELRLPISGARPLEPQASQGFELPSGPVIVVDDESWWRRASPNLWMGLTGLPGVVRLLLDFCGYGLGRMATVIGAQGGGAGAGGSLWARSLCCSRCRQPITIEWSHNRRNPMAICPTCGWRGRPWPSQLRDWLQLMNVTCAKCGGALDVRQADTGWRAACCRRGCQWSSPLDRLLGN